MAIAGTLSRLVWGGTLFDTEQWACSLHFNGTGHNGRASDFVSRISAYMISFPNGTATGWSSAAALTFVKWNPIAPLTGKYASLGTSDTADVAGIVRGAAPPAPGQCALAVSLTTALSRGRGHTGRYYMPAGNGLLGVDGSGQIDSGTVSGAASKAESFLSDIQIIANAPLVVYSKVGQLAVPVTGVRVGSVLDTQRRRRTSLVEQYESFPLVP